MSEKRLYVITTLGYPGSGKTHFAEQFCAEQKFIHLNSDCVRLEMIARPTYEVWENKMVFGAMHHFTKLMLQAEQCLVFDANMTRECYRYDLYKIVKACGAKYLLVLFDTPEAIAFERIHNRQQKYHGERRKYYTNIPDDAFYRIKNNIELPVPPEPFVTVDGSAGYEQQRDVVLRALSLAKHNTRK